MITITLHETRVKVRQDERVFTEWKESKNNLPQSIIHISQNLNRLSDFFFVLARYYSHNETIKPH
jgi:cob(I)alamin adenosyltransferase